MPCSRETKGNYTAPPFQECTVDRSGRGSGTPANGPLQSGPARGASPGQQEDRGEGVKTVWDGQGERVPEDGEGCGRQGCRRGAARGSCWAERQQGTLSCFVQSREAPLRRRGREACRTAAGGVPALAWGVGSDLQATERLGQEAGWR